MNIFRSKIPLAALFAFIGAVSAQGARPESADTVAKELPQVSVTAFKGSAETAKAETVTKISRTEIERLNIANIKQVSEITPNFYMPQYGSRMTSSVYVRGLGTRIDQPVVGLNIDNVPILNKDNFDFDLADIENIEIMRGPQNILYGRNTMGGLISIRTISPLSFEGVRITAEYADHNSYKGAIGLYGRLHSTLGMALNLYATGTDGFYRNAFNKSHTGKERQWSGRWKTTWRPSGNLIVENTASVAHSAQSGYPYQSVVSGKIEYNDTCFYRRLTVTDGLTLNGRAGNVNISGVASFQYINDNMTLDQDFLPLDYFTLTQKRHEWALTADIAAKSRPCNHYRWLFGAFGYLRRGEMAAPVHFHDYGITHLIEDNANMVSPQYPITWDQRTLPLHSRFTTPSSGGSFYHESAATIGAFTATLGLRWDWERAELRYHSYSNSSYTLWNATTTPPTALGTTPVDINMRGTLHKTSAQLLPKLSVSYTLPERAGNVFVSVTKGYKSGGYNTQMFSDVLQQRIRAAVGMNQQYDINDIVSYDPEKTWNYEAGAHISLLDGSLTLDGALFWIECRDQQLTMFPEGSVTGRVMANAGRSRSRGAEISGVYKFDMGLSARVSYGFTDARFTSFSNGRRDFNGCHVPYAPMNTLFVGVAYEKRFRNSFIDSFGTDINGRGVGRIYWDEANSLSQPFYGLLDASVRAGHKGFTAELWANNITATKYSTFYFVSIGNAFLQRGNGFQAGLTLRYELSFQ